MAQGHNGAKAQRRNGARMKKRKGEWENGRNKLLYY